MTKRKERAKPEPPTIDDVLDIGRAGKAVRNLLDAYENEQIKEQEGYGYMATPLDLLAEQNGLSLEQQEAAVRAWENVDLNEVVIDMVPVAIVEEIVEEYTDEGGVKRKRNKSYVRHTQIAARVSNDVYHAVMLTYQSMQAKFTSKKPEDQVEAMKWMRARVLEIWQLTEEDMTEKRLNRGLTIQQTAGLFKRFFAQMTLTVAQSQA